MDILKYPRVSQTCISYYWYS